MAFVAAVLAFVAGYLVHLYQATHRELEVGSLLRWLLARGHVYVAQRLVDAAMLRHARAPRRLRDAPSRPRALDKR